MKRWLTTVMVVALVGLAGCVAPEESEPKSVFVACPYWDLGDAVELQGLVRGGDNWTTPDAWLETEQGVLDLVQLRVVVWNATGNLQLRAFAGEEQVAFMDYRNEVPERVPLLVLGESRDATGVFEVVLNSVEQGTQQEAQPLHFRWNGDGEALWQAQVLPGYRVCGVP